MEMKDKYTQDQEEYLTDAKIAALLDVLERYHPNIWQEYDDALATELISRGCSPGELTLGYRIEH